MRTCIQLGLALCFAAPASAVDPLRVCMVSFGYVLSGIQSLS
jgi:hypothetical protein